MIMIALTAYLLAGLIIAEGMRKVVRRQKVSAAVWLFLLLAGPLLITALALAPEAQVKRVLAWADREHAKL